MKREDKDVRERRCCILYNNPLFRCNQHRNKAPTTPFYRFPPTSAKARRRRGKSLYGREKMFGGAGDDASQPMTCGEVESMWLVMV